MAIQTENENVRQLGKQIIQEHDLKFTYDYKGEIFTMKHPAPYDKAVIEAEIVRRLGGQRRDAFPSEHVEMIESTVYVNYMVVPDESPDWFVSAWTCLDETLIQNLYARYLQFRGEFRRKLSKDGFVSGSSSDSS